MVKENAHILLGFIKGADFWSLPCLFTISSSAETMKLRKMFCAKLIISFLVLSTSVYYYMKIEKQKQASLINPNYKIMCYPSKILF